MAFLPLKDDNPVVRIRFQYVTVTLMALSLLVFLYQQSLGDFEQVMFFMDWGQVPAALFGENATAGAWLALLTHPFVHSDWMHLIGNLLFLWVFGDNIEDELGHGRYLLFYFGCGILAAMAHGLITADPEIPLVGASGAISGILGAYLLRHPHAKVLVIAFVPIPVRLPTYVVLGIWIAINVINALMDLRGEEAVAWWAHVGGFAAGLLLIGLLTLNEAGPAKVLGETS